MKKLKISLLHLALKPGVMGHNYALIERGVRIAAASGADWVIAPELCISGYQFIDVVGTDWIAVHPNAWTLYIWQLARSLELTILFGHVERDRVGELSNCAFMVDAKGMIIGHHRKINTHAEQWARAGQVVEPVTCNGLKVGMLICADAYTKEITATLRSKGSQLLLSPAAWGPGLYGPEGEWEQRTAETGLPLVVCNRTGEEKTLTFLPSRESGGQRRSTAVVTQLAGLRSTHFRLEPRAHVAGLKRIRGYVSLRREATLEGSQKTGPSELRFDVQYSLRMYCRRRDVQRIA